MEPATEQFMNILLARITEMTSRPYPTVTETDMQGHLTFFKQRLIETDNLDAGPSVKAWIKCNINFFIEMLEKDEKAGESPV